MGINFSSLGSLLPKPDANVEARFSLNGEIYQVEEFDIDFSQGIDFKGQPQNETRGGTFSITLLQLPDNMLYEWAKKSRMSQAGSITFRSETSGTFFRVDFTNGYCVNLSTGVNSRKGAMTHLSVSCETIKINDTTHKNNWVNN